MNCLKISLFTLIIFLSGCIVVPTYLSEISLTHTSQNHQQVPISNVLLVGTGLVASRIFLDNLSDEMLRSFKKKGIHSEFKFIGKIPRSASLEWDSLKQAGYDSYLVFRAADSSYLDMTNEKFTAFGPGIMATKYGNQYKANYNITLYNGMKHEVLWEGELAVDFDIANRSRYQHIAKLIFTELEKNNILPD